MCKYMQLVFGQNCFEVDAYVNMVIFSQWQWTWWSRQQMFTVFSERCTTSSGSLTVNTKCSWVWWDYIQVLSLALLSRLGWRSIPHVKCPKNCRTESTEHTSHVTVGSFCVDPLLWVSHIIKSSQLRKLICGACRQRPLYPSTVGWMMPLLAPFNKEAVSGWLDV